jgi:MHS family proline/betaine transporter-like MFS transporter
VPSTDIARPVPQPGSEQTSLEGCRRAIAAGFVGTVIEYFEFGVYAYVAVLIAPAFFPSSDAAASLLATLAVFAASFFVRPLGGIFLGRWGDRYGRKRILLITVIGMGAATASIGLIPTFATIGAAAPVLLVAARLAQGFFAGGELMGASAYVVESSPSGERGRASAFVPAGAAWGGAIAAVVAGTTSAIIGPVAMGAWGWRIPFLAAVPLIVVSVWLRARMEETPAFTGLEEVDQVSKRPLSEALRHNWRDILKMIGLAFGVNVGYWVGLIYMTIYLTQVQRVDATSVFWIIAGVNIVLGILTPFGGSLSDRIGRRRTLMWGFAAYGVVVIPMMLLMSSQNLPVVAVATLVLALPFVLVQGTAYAAFAEMFPTRVRYTGMALSFNIATILGGGVMPYIATWLVSITGVSWAPGCILIAAAVLSLITLRTIGETAAQELRR